jgi:hypothetical protein
MNLDWRVCSRARLSRDARFDGKFFIGVRGSRVYCRPICPAPTAKEKNVRYFPTAAAAAEAGYRPCLRCRPECSPGTPAWLGTSNTVSRALRLIGESALEAGGMESLAERLGVGSRHLAPPVHPASGRVPECRRSNPAFAFREEVDRRNKFTHEPTGLGCGFRLRAKIQCCDPQDLQASADSNSAAGATEDDPSGESIHLSSSFSSSLSLARVCWRFSQPAQHPGSKR